MSVVQHQSSPEIGTIRQCRSEETVEGTVEIGYNKIDLEHTIVSTSRYVKNESPGLCIDSVVVVPTTPTTPMNSTSLLPPPSPLQLNRENSRGSRRSRSVRRESSRNRGRSSSSPNCSSRRREMMNAPKPRIPPSSMDTTDNDDSTTTKNKTRVSRGRTRQSLSSSSSTSSSSRGRSLGARLRDLSPFHSRGQKENILTKVSSSSKKKETTKNMENIHVGIRSTRNVTKDQAQGGSMFQKKKNSKIHHNILGRKIPLPPTGKTSRKQQELNRK